jgi:hypothetical protein
VRNPASHRTLKSDLAKVDRHSIRAHEYKDLPEFTEKALSRTVVNKGGRSPSANPRKLISIRLPGGCHRALEGDGTGLADARRGAPKQSALNRAA